MTDTDIGRMSHDLRDNAKELFDVWMFMPSRREEFGKQEIDDIRQTVIGLNAVLMQHDKQTRLKLVSL